MMDESTVILDGLTPRYAHAPSDYDTLARILKQSADERCVVVPYGGRTMLELGSPLRRVDLVQQHDRAEDSSIDYASTGLGDSGGVTPRSHVGALLALSLAGLNRVLDHQPANLTVRVQAGMTLAGLNRELAPHGQFLPLDPPFPERATLGGILATNAGGALRVRFGSARDLLIGLRVALLDGQIVRGGGDVVKNVAGYDLPKLFVGSLGTLGVIVEASFKLAPLPAVTGTVTATFDSMEHASAVALRILHSPLLPTGIEILNRRAGAELNLKEGYTLAVRFGGLASAVAQQLRQVQEWAGENNPLTTGLLDSDLELWARLRDSIFDHPVVVKIGLLPTQLNEIASETEGLAFARGLTCSYRAHAVGILYAALDGDSESTGQAITDLRQAVLALKGYLIVQRAPRELRERVDVWGPTPSDFALMQRLKQEFDPNGVLNPGRFVGGI